MVAQESIKYHRFLSTGSRVEVLHTLSPNSLAIRVLIVLGGKGAGNAGNRVAG